MKFAYDHLGRRIAKWVWVEMPGGAWRLEKDLRFVYDGWNMIAELDHTFAPADQQGFAGMNSTQAQRSVQRTFLWGQDLSGTMTGAGGVGGLLSTTYQGVTYHVCNDANGNVTGLVPANGPDAGKLIARFDYDPFGNRITNTGPDVELCPMGFSSKYTDTETRLVYYGFRYYSPKMGRWLSRDPIVELSFQMLTKGMHRAQLRDELNLYSFVANDPVNNLDILGLHEFKNCNASQQGIINRAVGSAKGMVSRSLTNLGGISSDATASASYKRWFGGYTKSSHRRVKRVYNRVQRQLNGNITFDCCCNMPGVYAYVKVPDFKLKIWLCDEFWKAPASGRDSQPGTIIHELSHESWFSGTDDLAYGEIDADALPTTQAINNADSYQYFAEDQ